MRPDDYYNKKGELIMNRETPRIISVGRYKHIGVAIDEGTVLYINLLDDGTVVLRWVVDRDFIENNKVFSINSKSGKEYLVADMVVHTGNRCKDRNLAKKVYEYCTDGMVGDWQVIHHLLGQFICLFKYMTEMERDEHDTLHRLTKSVNKYNMSVEEFFLRHVMTIEQYYDILKPNLNLILTWMLENSIKSNFVSLGDVCLYETKLDSIGDWQSHIKAR